MKLMQWLFLVIIAVSVPAMAGTDVSKLDINGYRLGMTIDEVKEKNSNVKIDPIKPDGKTLIGYKAKVGNTILNFTSDEFGNELFNIQMVKVYGSKPDVKIIFDELVEKYGTPDYTGRQMFHVQACWGRCYGKNKRLEFRLKISNVTDKPYPMSLTLSDPITDRTNRRFFLKQMSGD